MGWRGRERLNVGVCWSREVGVVLWRSAEEVEDGDSQGPKDGKQHGKKLQTMVAAAANGQGAHVA
jgi:hypothetical protein